MDIKISCIIPYYNIEKELLFQCVNSILKQDFQGYEIIVVDDGSDEVYAAYLQDISSLDDRIKIISQPNLGVSAARNTGIRNAEGEYITFVDADDFIVPYFFSEAYEAAVENDADYVIGGVLTTQTRNPEILRSQIPEIEIRDSVQYRPSVIRITDHFSGGGYLSRGPVAKLIKKNILADIVFPENLRLGEDNIWNLDVISKCDKIFIVYQIWYIYWRNPSSVSHGYNNQMIALCDEFLNELIQRVDFQNENEAAAFSSRIYELLKKHIYDCYLGCKECPLPVMNRFKLFRELCQKEPWTEYGNELYLKNCGRKEKMKQVLVNSGMIYWYWFVKDLFRRN